jgi:hypothetical protein
MIQCRVAALEKDMPFPFGLRLVLDHLGRSESIKTTVLVHWFLALT